ncbi:glycosyltransferase family 4 protein [Desulfoferrobacter suflitae]|uniref:glycosyltransferase family 4 protein n=1 Tax=Desulfoferrobacter suflitae TaxID=2865782 RepID=UPI0021643AE3|nr:glycosyltransferase family 4 protein [Desulfoferrobacter suflitae]MCK8602164.1 glycosyltransferase family 4 protein [Desulfoferrobacter suflitae]
MTITPHNFAVSLYAPLRAGGPKIWACNLARELEKNGVGAAVKDTLRDYFREPLDRFIVHSSLPFVSRPRSRKYVLTIHGDFRSEANPWGKFYPLAIRRATVTTVPNNFLKETLGLGAACVVENGIERPTFIKQDFRLGTLPRLGLLSNFNFRQKAEGILELARIARNISFRGQVVIGGDGKLFTEYVGKAKEIFPETVFLGFVPKEEFFEQIDIFCYYSQQDVQPIALLDAMASGLPVLTNGVGGIPEIVPAELLANNHRTYGEKLEQLLAAPASRIANSELARKAAAPFFFDRVVQKWISIYQNV